MFLGSENSIITLI